MHNWHISSWFYEWSDGMQRICSHIGKNIYQTEFTCGLRLVCTANKKNPPFYMMKKPVVNIAFHEDWVLDKEWIELGVFWLDLILSPPCPFTCAFLSFTTFSFLSVIGIFASPSELRSTILIPFSECQQLRCKSFSGFCCFGLSFMLSSLMAERFCGNYLLGSIVVMTYSLADYYKQQ